MKNEFRISSINLIEFTEEMDPKKATQMWYEFAEIPIDEKECIEEDFYCWSKGTDCFEIRDWFDKYLPNGIYPMLLQRMIN